MSQARIRSALIMRLRGIVVLALLFSAAAPATQALADEALAKKLRELDATVLPDDETSRRQHQRMLAEHARERLFEANRDASERWHAIKSKQEWAQFVRPRIEAMRKAIAHYPPAPDTVKFKVTRTIEGDGFEIRNIVYESRPGLIVTANLYAPKPLRKSMPGIVIVHSHHRPKTHPELQDMGMNWARAGCYVLVPDQINHGERRQHPFITDADFDKSFRVSRQDYYFRYNVAMHLYLAGESLIGWMAWDNMRGFDLLLQQPGIDGERLVIIGSVAGGGDPAAVTAALDERIDCLIPFNFGGPQPETRYPLPEDIEESFNYAGGGSWESTRNIAFSARDGFLPWVIVSSVAPRRLIHAHEFVWHRERDPVWKRYQRIWGEFYDKPDDVAFAHGYGELRQSGSEASHCTHVGAAHRKMIYPSLEKWFNIAAPETEYRGRRDEADLLCLTEGVAASFNAKTVREVALREAETRRNDQQAEWATLSGANRRKQLNASLAAVLGIDRLVDRMRESPESVRMEAHARRQVNDGLQVDAFIIRIGDGVTIPVLLLRHAPQQEGEKSPVVVMVAQAGKQALLQHRADEIAALLKAGVAVCLADLRGTGETRPGDDRGQYSWSTSLAASELMLGQPLVGSRLLDLTLVMGYLGARRDIDASRIAVWGDSLAAPNPPDRPFRMPLRVDGLPRPAEPLGAMLALLAAESGGVKAVVARGGVVSFASVMDSPFIHLPFDTIVPGIITQGDLPFIAAELAPKPIYIGGTVDGWNRAVDIPTVEGTYAAARKAYGDRDGAAALHIAQPDAPANDAVQWLLKQLKR